MIRYYLKAGWFITCLLFCAHAFAQSDYYYYGNGVKRPLWLSPTKVTVRFTPAMTQNDIRNFILSDSALSPRKGPFPLLERFLVLYVQPGSDIESLVQRLRARQEVEMANPVYLLQDSAVVLVTDQFVTQFSLWVPHSTIDSLNALHGVVIHDSISPQAPNLYLLKLTGKLNKDVLTTANQYYEEPTTDYSHPDFIARICFDNCDYVAGDFDGDSSVTVADIVLLINYLFKFSSPLLAYMGDMNCDGKVTLCDAVFLVSYLFKQGPKPEDCLWSP